MSREQERLERLLGGESLRQLRERARRRLATRAMAGGVTFSRLSPDERRALEGLLGRRARAAQTFRVALSELDEALRRAGLADSFRHALELLDGPIVDPHAQRATRALAWEAAFVGVEVEPLARFLLSAESRGLVKRLSRGDAIFARGLLDAAARLLMRLPALGVPRSQLAAEVLGDAHGLDAGQPVAAVVLSVLRSDEDHSDRDTWARAGVLVNELAAPALVLNLPAHPGTLAGRLAATAREYGEPLHLSLRCLMRETVRWGMADRTVFVCENPNLVAIAASRLGPACAPLVCTDGMPSASQRVLLQALVAQGARLYVHCDFDWAGLRIANFVVRTHGARPWRMGAGDYDCDRGRRLEGNPVAASWDPELGPKMEAAGYALEEEAMADVLVEDLRAPDCEPSARG